MCSLGKICAQLPSVRSFTAVYVSSARDEMHAYGVQNRRELYPSYNIQTLCVIFCMI